MKKLIIGIIVIVVAYGIYTQINKGGSDDKPRIKSDLSSYFQDKMFELGVADIGQPIEGFDNNLLIKAFPGLIPADFQGVQTAEGLYEVTGATVDFIRNEKSPITSAERTVSEQGYGTLLTNVAQRFNMEIKDRAAVDTLINMINTDDVTPQG